MARLWQDKGVNSRERREETSIGRREEVGERVGEVGMVLEEDLEAMSAQLLA